MVYNQEIFYCSLAVTEYERPLILPLSFIKAVCSKRHLKYELILVS